MKYRLLNILGAASAVSFLALSSFAAEESDSNGRSGPEEAAVRAAAGHMHRLKLQRLGEPENTISLIDQPLLAFGDSARDTSQGTLWAWSDGGRPVLFLELYQIGGFEGQWFHALSLATEPNVTLDAPAAYRWQPRTTDFHPRPLEKMSEPAVKDAGRLRQMRDAARRFAAHEFWHPDNSRHELRVLPQPIHRYSDSDQRVQDGAVFAIVHGTNPEGMVLIEALDQAVDSSRWQYAVLRSSDAELHVDLDGQAVFRCDRGIHDVTGLRRPYYVFTTGQEADVDPAPSKGNG
jgi:hypothetical protein